MPQLADVQRSLIKTIRKWQMKFLAYLSRKNGIEKLALYGKIEGRRSRGRQRQLNMDSLNTFATKQQMTNIELIIEKTGEP